jgi:hypothetical protein
MCEQPQVAIGTSKIEVGHPAPEQLVSLAQIIVEAQSRLHRSYTFARLVRGEELGDYAAQRLGAVVGTVKRNLCHRIPQHAGGDGVVLGVVGIQ